MAEIIKINDNTWRIEDGFVRFFLLAGDEKALLIDGGMTTKNARQIAETLTDLPLEMLNTHGDIDHTAGNVGFDSFYMHPADYKNNGIAKRLAGALIPIADGDVLDLGNRQLELIGIPGHTYGSMAILDKANRMLFAGDTVQTNHIYMYGSHRCPEKLVESLDKLAARKDEFDRIFASHGEAEVPPEHIGVVKDAWLKVQAGQVPGKEVTIGGQKVMAYHTGECGFYLR